MNLLILTLPLITALVLYRLLKLNYSVFQVIYLIALAGALFAGYQLDYSPLPILLIGLLGEALHFTLLGFNVGFGVKNNAVLSSALGLFPWYYGVLPSVIYATSFVLIIVFLTVIRIKTTRRKMGVRAHSQSFIKKELGDRYDEYIGNFAFIYAIPALIAVLIAVGVAYIS